MILPLNGFNLIHVKQRLHMRRREVCPNSWSRHPNQMLFTPIAQWTFGENMWRSFMESPHFNTSSIRDKWHRWKSYSTSKRRHFCSTATIRIGWKVVVWLYGMLLLPAKRPRPPGRWEKLRMKDDLENHCKGQWYILEQWLNVIWFHWKKVLPGIFLGHESVAGWIGTRNFLIADLEKSERLDASEIYPWRINAKTKKMMKSYSQ